MCVFSSTLVIAALCLCSSAQLIITDGSAPSSTYPNNVHTERTLTSNATFLQLTFTRMDIESHSSCAYDYVSVYDGPSTASALLGKFCGSAVPAPVASTSPTLTVVFHSDSGSGGLGFEAQYVSLDPWTSAEACPGPLALSDAGTLDVSLYAASLACSWRLEAASPAHVLLIRFPTLDCGADELFVAGWGNLCTDAAPDAVLSTGQEAAVTFVSDADSSTGLAFAVEYESVVEWSAPASACSGSTQALSASGTESTIAVGVHNASDACSWEVSAAAAGDLVVVEFESLAVVCGWAYVEVVATGQQYCGDTAPPVVQSSSSVELRYVSTAGAANVGFTATYKSVGADHVAAAGAVLIGDGSFTDGSDAGSNYPNSYDRTWTLASAKQLVMLTFTRMDIESHSSCAYDYVSVYDGPSTASALLGKFCGSAVPAPVASTSPTLTVVFHSDSGSGGLGFEAQYVSLDPWTSAEACPGPLALSDAGTLDVSLYAASLACSWRLEAASPAHVLLIRFPTLDCGADELFVAGWGNLCTDAAPDAVLSTGQEAAVTFVSDADSSTGLAFAVEYESVVEWSAPASACSGSTQALSASGTESTIAVGVHNASDACSWEVSAAAAGDLVVVEFESLAVVCGWAYVEVVATGQQYCGDTAPPVVQSSSSVELRYVSTAGAANVGFTATYKSVGADHVAAAGAVLIGDGSFTDGSDAGSNYPNSYDRTWTLASAQQFVMLAFSRIDVACDGDYVSVYDGPSTASALLGKFCGSAVPAPVASTSSTLTVVFHSDSFDEGRTGFTAHFQSFSPAPTGPACPGPLALSAPGVVSLTPHSAPLNCTWEVSPTSPAHTASVTFNRVFTHSMPTCATASLQVWSGFVLLRELCGLYAQPFTVSACTPGAPLTLRYASLTSSLGFDASLASTVASPATPILLLGSSVFVQGPACVIVPPLGAPARIEVADLSATCGLSGVGGYSPSHSWRACHGSSFVGPVLDASATTTVVVHGDATATVSVAAQTSGRSSSVCQVPGSDPVVDVVSSLSRAQVLAVADVDGDATVDVVSGHSPTDTTSLPSAVVLVQEVRLRESQYGLKWFANSGGTPPVFTPHAVSPVVFDVVAVAVADVNGDGFRDVVAVVDSVWSTNSDGVASVQTLYDVMWWPNSGGVGASAFAGEEYYVARLSGNLAGNPRAALVVADVDADGDVDVLWFARSALAWQPGTGGFGRAAFTFGAHQAISTPSLASTAVRGVVAAPVCGGSTCVVVAVSSGAVVALAHDPSGWYEHAVLHDTSGVSAYNPLAAAASFGVLILSDDALVQLRPAANATFVLHNVTTAVDGGSAVAIGDMDGDGVLDPVLAVASSDTVAYFSAGDGFTHHLVTTAADGVRTIFATDVDGDGDGGDVVFAAHSADRVAVALSSGVPRLIVQPGAATRDAGWSDGDSVSCTLADMDGDGALDAVVRPSSGGIQWHRNLNDGSGVFDSVATSVYSGSVYSTFAVGDLSRTGTADVVYIRPPLSFFPVTRVVASENGGDGTSWSASTVGTLAASVQAIAVGDVTGNGLLDVVVCMAAEFGTLVYTNTFLYRATIDAGTGDLDFESSVSVGSSGDVVGLTSLALADVTGDGLADVITSSESDNKIAFTPSSGQAQFDTPQVVVSTAAREPQVVTAVDVDRDGRMDLLVASSGDSAVAWLRNDGNNGTAWTRHVVSDTAGGVFWVGLDADLDGDGLLDVSYIAQGGQPTTYTVGVFTSTGLPGDAAFTTTPVLIMETTTQVHTAAWGDIDQDGDVDVVVGSEGRFLTFLGVPSRNTVVVAAGGSMASAVAAAVATPGTGSVTVFVPSTAVLDLPAVPLVNLRRPVVVRGGGRLVCPSTTSADAAPHAAMATCGGYGGSLTFRNVSFVGCHSAAGLILAFRTAVMLDSVTVEAGAPQPSRPSAEAAALFTVTDDSTLTVLLSSVSAATSHAGRAVAAVDSDVVMDRCSLACSGTAVDGDGGALSAVRSSVRTPKVPSVSLVDTQLTDCAATGRGGALYTSSVDLSMARVQLHRNVAGDSGGAAHLDTFSDAVAHSVVADGNRAGTGGAMAVAADSTLAAHDCVLTGNVAVDAGGALAVSAASAAVSTSQFRGNFARDGGCVAVDAATVSMNATSFEACDAQNSGGALHVALTSASSRASFTDCRVTSSVARNGDGGALYYAAGHDDATLTWSGGVLQASAPLGRGAAVFCALPSVASQSRLPTVTDLVQAPAGGGSGVMATPVAVGVCFQGSCCRAAQCPWSVSLEQLHADVTFTMFDAFGVAVGAGGVAASCALVLPTDPSVAVGGGVAQTVGPAAAFPSVVVAGVVGATYTIRAECAVPGVAETLVSGTLQLQVPACSRGQEPDDSGTSCRSCSAGFFLLQRHGLRRVPTGELRCRRLLGVFAVPTQHVSV